MHAAARDAHWQDRCTLAPHDRSNTLASFGLHQKQNASTASGAADLRANRACASSCRY